MVEGARRATGTIPSPDGPRQTRKMTTTNPSEGPHKAPGKKRRFLSAEKKFQIYLAAQSNDKPVGELLRREGLYSTDLIRIRAQVKEAALQRLGAKPGHQQGHVSSAAYDALKSELQDKERALADLAVELAILQKNEWGFVGPIAGRWLQEQTKLDILTVIETSRQQGVPVRRSCSILAIAHRRIVRWQQKSRRGESLADLTPGSKEPLRRVLPEEPGQPPPPRRPSPGSLTPATRRSLTPATSPTPTARPLRSANRSIDYPQVARARRRSDRTPPPLMGWA